MLTGTPIPDLEKEVEENLDAAARSEEEAQRYYEAAGARLKQLKENMRLKQMDVTWSDYVRDKFDLSQQRADELIRIAEGKTTVKKVRELAREGMRKSRAKQRQSRDGRSKNTNILAFTKRLLEFHADFVNDMVRWRIENKISDDEDRAHLVDALHQCANELTLLAQRFDPAYDAAAMTKLKDLLPGRRARRHAP